MHFSDKISQKIFDRSEIISDYSPYRDANKGVVNMTERTWEISDRKYQPKVPS
jgi:hypothetical protein